MLLSIQLVKNPDKSVSGKLPSGLIVTWDKHNSNKPTKRNKRVMLNCYYWAPFWVDAFQ